MSVSLLARPAVADAPLRGRSRDGFLDLLRAAATVRVALWHAYGAPWLTWVLASIPAMFFVSGALLARSAERRNLVSVLGLRFRRLALPLWTFATVAWVAMAAAAVQAGDSLPLRRVVWWFVPVFDPVGTSWEGGWLASPLWYLRALIWVLLASPLLLVIARRAPRIGISAGVVAVVVCEALVRRGSWTPEVAPRLWWYAADFALYATFFTAGAMSERPGWAQRRLRSTWALVPIGAGAAWALTIGVPSGVVNDSHVLHLLVGAAWLVFALSWRTHLRSLANRDGVRRVLEPFTRYSLTIYLWHSTAIVVALAIRSAVPGSSAWWGSVVFPVVVLALVVVAVGAFGALERRAGRPRRSDRSRRPVRVPAAGGIVTAALLVLAHTPTPTASARVPSQAPPTPREIDLIVAEDRPVTPRELPAALDRLFQDWLGEQGSAGGSIGILGPDGWRWTSAAGVWREDGRAVTLEDTFEAMSVTKMLTASLVVRAITSGLMGIDEPIGDIGASGIDAAQRFTPRQLLEHTTGLADWRAAPEAAIALETATIIGPAEAVRSSLQLPRAASVPSYSSTNSILAAMTLEGLFGVPFEDLARAELQRLALDDSAISDPAVNAVNHGSAGLITTIDDLLRLTDAILVTHDGVDDRLNRAMRAPDPATGVGLGTVGLCPCDDAAPSYFGLVGHYGGYTIAAIDPTTDFVIVLNLTESLWEAPGVLEATDAFLLRLLRLAAGSLDR